MFVTTSISSVIKSFEAVLDSIFCFRQAFRSERFSGEEVMSAGFKSEGWLLKPDNSEIGKHWKSTTLHLMM
jgi:hypothetical protein